MPQVARVAPATAAAMPQVEAAAMAQVDVGAYFQCARSRESAKAQAGLPLRGRGARAGWDIREEEPIMKCVVSVLGKDRSGIVAAVATALAECGANIDDISQTILGGIFSMTMMVTLDVEVADFNTAQERLDAVAEDLGVQITLQREDVFQYMYKI